MTPRFPRYGVEPPPPAPHGEQWLSRLAIAAAILSLLALMGCGPSAPTSGPYSGPEPDVGLSTPDGAPGDRAKGSAQVGHLTPTRLRGSAESRAVHERAEKAGLGPPQPDAAPGVELGGTLWTPAEWEAVLAQVEARLQRGAKSVRYWQGVALTDGLARLHRARGRGGRR